jgi:hypothetical protein
MSDRNIEFMDSVSHSYDWDVSGFQSGVYARECENGESCGSEIITNY